MDLQTISLADQLQATVRDILQERGLGNCGTVEEYQGQMVFIVSPKEGMMILPEMMEEIMEEAARRLEFT